MSDENHTLGRLAEEAWARHSDHDSLFFEGTWFRSHELAERARRATGGFIAAGVRPGDRVIVLMANCPEVFITYTALWRAGAVVTPVVFLASEDEVRHILRDSGARVVVTTAEWTEKIAAAADGRAGLDVTVVVAGEAPPGTVALAELEKAAESPVVDRDPGDLAAVMYTGGTTGQAKGVVLTNDGLWRVAKAGYDRSHVAGVNRAIIPLPLSHAYGLIVTIAGMHAEEPGASVLQRWFDAKQWLSLAAEHRVQLGAVVPAMLQLLLAEPLEEADLSELRYLSSGAAPLAREVLEQFERRVPGVRIIEGYGLTETSAVTSVNPPSRRRIGSVGLPLDCYQIVIRDDDGNELPAGADGEICVRGTALMLRYWNAPEATAAALSEDGHELRTGDIGHLDADGYLFIADRKKDLIIRNGFNVYPRDVEDALVGHPDVAMAGVVGRPDAVAGEEVVAFVMPRWGAHVEAGELTAFARQRLAATKYPREIHVVDAIPMTSVGKLDRKKLRAMLAGKPGGPEGAAKPPGPGAGAPASG
jgi:long-chain acyl-CoA synthetase